MKVTTTLASSHTPDGESLVLQEHDGQYHLKVGGVTLMSTTACNSEQEMAEIACENVHVAPRILIGGLGFGFTLKRVLELVSKDAVVDVAELLPEMISWNKEFLQEVNGKLLDDPRVEIVERDVFEIISRCGSDRYDAILLDVDNSPDPLVQGGNARLYGKKGLQITRSALNPRGRVVYWSANQDRAFERLLEKVFKDVEAVGAKAYPQAKKFTHTLFVGNR